MPITKPDAMVSKITPSITSDSSIKKKQNTSKSTSTEAMGITVLINNVTQFEEFSPMIFTISLVDENDNSILVTSASDVNITLNTADGTAAAGQYNIANSPFDYTPIVNDPLTIPAGLSSATFEVIIIDDGIYELNESFTLNGIVTSGNTVNTEISGIGTIENNDTLPLVSINNNATTTNGAAEGETINFTIRISHPSSTPVLFEATTFNNQAVSPFDFEGFIDLALEIDGTVDENNANTEVSFSVTTLTDNTNERNNERFDVAVTVTSGNTADPVIVAVAIVRDIDPDPLVSVEDQEAVEGNSLTFTITIVNPNTGEPMFNYQDINFFIATQDNEAIVLEDYLEFTDFGTIAAGEQSFVSVVETIDDQLNEETETFYLQIELVDVDDLSNGDDIVLGTGSIIDNDVPNLFSPNQDGIGDVFRIAGLEEFPDFTITIFDRWGSQVYNYSNNGRTEPLWWDGTYQGKQVPEGVYYYNLHFNDNITTPKSNFIQLVR